LQSQQEESKTSKPVLEVKDLRVVFHTYAGTVKALEGVNLTLLEGETVGLVGESGCGKSVTAAAIVGLLPENAEVVSGEILFRGEDLLKKSSDEKRILRSRKLAIVFQDPMTFLNPVLTVGEQLTEVFELDKRRLARAALERRIDRLRNAAQKAGEAERVKMENEIERLERVADDPPMPGRREKRSVLKAMAKEVLTKMRLPDPERILKEYPHELSGGMRQRVMIAMAIARNPELLIADEITTALDVTIQAQILELLRILKQELNSTILIITHDLGVVADICDRVAVMYAGAVVEVAESRELYGRPLHPYTQGLLRAIPRLGIAQSKLESIAGSVPDLIYPPSGCRFHPRCPYAWELCSRVKPKLVETSEGHFVACHLYKEKEAHG
jgi:peptide/nickel transport system ATP-binding protein